MNYPVNNAVLSEMLKELETTSKLYKPSIFWEDINKFHIKHITNYGIKHFKRSLNREYFDWGISSFRYQLSPIFLELGKMNIQPIIKSKLINKESKYITSAPQFSALLASWLRSKNPLFFKVSVKLYTPFNRVESLFKTIYKIHVAYIFDYVRRIDKLGLLKKLREPSLGNPLLIGYRGKLISQDLCNSVHEFYSITKDINMDKKIKIAELGAGYGRLAYVFLHAVPTVTYCIIDLPPALYVSQEYLTKIFPKENIFTFRHFKNFKEIEKKFVDSRIAFLMPQQIEYLPDNYFDIVINISSLGEMRRDQINNYIKQQDRLSKGYVYLKQWKQSRAQDNNFIKEEEYKIPKKWGKIYYHTHPIQNLFFEALYKTRSKSH